ncbi:ornithine--oxo-acid transaminase [Gracilibacillus caseinilyticus]|uniref:Ornithine aminotransferase n=1 Tax=Gracilibacillus caseinilyticus TaxID=2932256 RepID=A0ABY4EXI9_9BACI|nr:ornithine--oxo-acid transaminase [Gracilibacillus caseinilyticus]UOQ48680.1 ornithine--oxo-acid transaminase [Gracilibacillus caseinilyticus]
MAGKNDSQKILEQTSKYGAHNYRPLSVVITEAKGVWVKDIECNDYLDMLSGYSSLNQGHRHPKIIKALKEQADHVTLTSRAFHHDQLGTFFQKVAELTGKEKVLPMNTGAEAVETAVKAARRWAYDKKGIREDQAEIIACQGNFHGRTMTAVSLSSEAGNQRAFGPMLPGLKLIPYGDIEALKTAITPNTAAFLMEPIQGEAGIIIPPAGYLQEVWDVCQNADVLWIADEVQTGLGRTGKMFACDWEEVSPDMYLLGKALGGGVMPISCIAADQDIMQVFNPGSHGSTFGGNPLACAVAIASLQVIEEEKLAACSLMQGEYLLQKIKQIEHPAIKEVRGKGLFIGMELNTSARPYCEKLKEKGVLCKETHENVIRFAPPLVITEEELDWAIARIKCVFV